MFCVILGCLKPFFLYQNLARKCLVIGSFGVLGNFKMKILILKQGGEFRFIWSYSVSNPEKSKKIISRAMKSVLGHWVIRCFV